MPIALLLAELQKRRREWTPMLADWSRLLATEELLWRRARGAFLRKWFGPGLQMEGTGLLVVVQNIDVLRSQLLFARAQSESDVNLMEPLMGMMGGLVGGVIGVLLGFFQPWASVGIPIALAVIAGVIGVGGIGFGLWAQTDSRFQAGFRASASLARTIEELLTFWGWITGPRSE